MRTRRSRERVPRTFLERLAVLPRGHGPSEPARRQGGLDRRAGVHDRADVLLAHGAPARQRGDRGSAVARIAVAADAADCASDAFGCRLTGVRVASGGYAHADGTKRGERCGRGGTLGRTGVRGRASDRRGGAPGTRRGGGSRHRGGGGRGGLRGGPCEGRRLPTFRGPARFRRGPPAAGRSRQQERAASRRPCGGPCAHTPSAGRPDAVRRRRNGRRRLGARRARHGADSRGRRSAHGAVCAGFLHREGGQPPADRTGACTGRSARIRTSRSAGARTASAVRRAAGRRAVVTTTPAAPHRPTAAAARRGGR